MARTFLITGASKGIGLALLQRLVRSEHHVVGLARHTVADFPGTLVPVDLSDQEATGAVLADLTDRFIFDGAVNNVGLVRLQRLGAIAFLLPEEAGFITGQTIHVDGGASIGKAGFERLERRASSGQTTGWNAMTHKAQTVSVVGPTCGPGLAPAAAPLGRGFQVIATLTEAARMVRPARSMETVMTDAF